MGLRLQKIAGTCQPKAAGRPRISDVFSNRQLIAG
jgi:hypothetical protein